MKTRVALCCQSTSDSLHRSSFSTFKSVWLTFYLESQPKNFKVLYFLSLLVKKHSPFWRYLNVSTTRKRASVPNLVIFVVLKQLSNAATCVEALGKAHIDTDLIYIS